MLSAGRREESIRSLRLFDLSYKGVESELSLARTSWYTKSSEAHFTRLRFKTPAQEARLIEIAKRNAIAHTPSYVLRESLKRHGEKVAMLWSGGRCSTVVVHMIRKIKPQIKVLFVNTGVEYPETVAYVKKLGKEWGINLEILKPERTFWEISKVHGPPTARRPSNMRRGEPDTPPCCFWLKKKPVRDFVRENEIKALITGMRAGESTVRAIAFRQKGAQFYFVKREKIWKYNPLAFWNTRRVSEYIAKNDIPLNPLYLNLDRVGCWPCSAFFGWRTELSETNPRLYEALNRIFDGASMSSCPEGKAMNHVSFENRGFGERVAGILSSLGMETEIHKEEGVICIPSIFPRSLLKRVIEEARLGRL